MLGVVGAGVVGAAMFLWQAVDVRQLIPQLADPLPAIPVPELPPPAARDGREFTAVLFSSPRNQAYFPDAGYYRTALDAWVELIEESGGRIREVVDAEGLRGLEEAEVLVLLEGSVYVGRRDGCRPCSPGRRRKRVDQLGSRRARRRLRVVGGGSPSRR